MKRKLVVSLFFVANATVVSGLAQHHPNRCSLATAIADDGTQPPAPPPGHRTGALVADGTQPPAPPPGRSAAAMRGLSA
jgi:hypothetical protein